MAQNWLVVCASDGSPLKDSTDQHDNSEVNTIKCIGVSTTPSKTPPPLFCQVPPLNLQTVQANPFLDNPRYILVFLEPPSPHLKTGFFRFLVNPHDIKTFLLLNISDFSFFLQKKSPPLSHQPSSKN